MMTATMTMRLHTGEAITLDVDSDGYEMIIGVEEPGHLVLTIGDLIRWRALCDAAIRATTLGGERQ